MLAYYNTTQLRHNQVCHLPCRNLQELVCVVVLILSCAGVSVIHVSWLPDLVEWYYVREFHDTLCFLRGSTTRSSSVRIFLLPMALECPIHGDRERDYVYLRPMLLLPRIHCAGAPKSASRTMHFLIVKLLVHTHNILLHMFHTIPYGLPPLSVTHNP